MHGWRLWLRGYCVTLMLMLAGTVHADGDVMVPEAEFAASGLRRESAPWLVESNEGVWLGGGQHTLFLPGLSLTGLVANLGLVVVGHLLSQVAGYAAGSMGAGWYAFDAVNAGRSASGKIELAVSQLSARMVLLICPAVDNSTVLTILRNPLATSVKLSKNHSRFARVMSDLHREMFRQEIERLDIRLSQDNGQPTLALAWRSATGRGDRLLNVVFRSGADVPGWLESYRFDDENGVEPTVPLISPLQPELMAHVVAELRQGGRESEIRPPTVVDIPALSIRRWHGFFSAVLDSGRAPVIIEGIRASSTLVVKKIKQLSDEDREYGGIWHGIWIVPRMWSASAQALFNLLFIGWHHYTSAPFDLVSALRPVVETGIEPATTGQTKKTRLQLLQNGEVAVAGMAATATRKIIGNHRILKVNHDDSLKDGNFIGLSKSLEKELLETLDSFPWTFELTGQGGRKYWVAINGNTFTDASSTLSMSPHVSSALHVKPGEEVDFQPVRLKPLKELFVGLDEGGHPVSDDAAVEMLAEALQNRHWTLHQGERIRARQNGHDYFFKVLKMEPEGVAYTPRCQAVLHVGRSEQPPFDPDLPRRVAPIRPPGNSPAPGKFFPFSGKGYLLQAPDP